MNTRSKSQRRIATR